MLTALTFRQSAGVVICTCTIIRNGLRAYAWGHSLVEAHTLAMDLLMAMELSR